MGFGGYDHWKTTEPDYGDERPDDGPSELDLAYDDLARTTGDLERISAAGRKLIAALDDYYDVDDGRPNIPGEIMLAARELDQSLKGLSRPDERGRS